MASWKRNRTKPFVVTASNGKKLIMFKAEIPPRRYSYNGMINLPLPNGQRPDEETPVEELSPMISNSANLMMSAMYTPLDQLLMGGQALGPPEAFFPFTDIDASGSVLQDSPSSYDEEDVDDEDLWRLEDLIDFNTAYSEDGDTEQEDSAAPSSTPARPATSTCEDRVNPLLVNPRLVGAFRNNQDRHQLLSRNKASRESLAFSGPLNQGPIRGIKDNRLAAANTPITPMRRQRAYPLPSSPASPLVRHQNKRKFSGEEMGHKRSKSLA
jgi:hypothetical protein